MPEQHLPPAWSKSSLANLLDGCAWQWALKKVFGLDDPGSPATVRGVGFHAAIELHERTRLVRARDEYGPELPTLEQMHDHGAAVIRAGAAELPPSLWEAHGTEADRLVDELWVLLGNWFDAPYEAEGHADPLSLRRRVLSWRPVAVEPYFRVALGRAMRPGHGYIDAIYWDGYRGEWVVVDQKSAGNFRRWEGPEGHELEAAMYVHGALKARGLPVRGERVRMEWHIVRPIAPSSRTGPLARVIELPMDGTEAEHRSIAEVSVAEQLVVDGYWPKNTAWNLCSPRWCAFYEGCEVTGELAPERMLG